MKRIYIFCILFCLVIYSSCSKDFLKSYDNRIIGTWTVTDVDRFGLGGSITALPFTSGKFTFHKNGTLNYVNSSNLTFNGNWEIVKKVINDQTVRSLHITAIDFTNQQVLAEYYDDMQFTGTDRFRANIIKGLHTYVTHFRR